jgi:membrane carboxypeptidase/penicillin-binding protein PbpC
VRWHIDGKPVRNADWPLVPGRHTITAISDAGDRAEVKIYVK